MTGARGRTKQSAARERLLHIADELFYARGLHAVGIDEIIEKSGTAKATLYAHFPTKDDLIASYLRQRSAQWREHLMARLAAAPPSPSDRIDAIFGVLADGCGTPGFRGCPFINAAVEYPDPRHPASVAGDEHRGWIRQLLWSLAVETRAPNPDLLAAQLSLVYDAAMVGTQMNRNPEAATQARDIARVLLDTARQHRGRAPRSAHARASRAKSGGR